MAGTATADGRRGAEPLARFVAGLTADVPGDVTPVNSPAELANAGAGLTACAVGWAVALGRRCSDATRAAQADRAAQLPEDDTRHAIETSMLGLLRRLSGDTSAVPVNERQLALARTMARLDRPYEGMVLGLRMSADMALDALLDAALRFRPADARTDLLRSLTHGVAAYFDDSVRGVIAEYLAERQRAIAKSVAARRRMVSALIAGESVPADLAAATLGIDLGQHHLALVLWRQGQAGSAALTGEDAAGTATAWSKNQLEPAVGRAAGRLRASASLIMPGDESLPGGPGDALLCWLTSPVPFGTGYLESLSGLFDASREVCVAAGVPGQGAAGFRRSHLAARDAYRIARHQQEAVVTGYPEVAALALLSADTERAHWFVTEELGRLSEPGPALDDLRETALTYLDSGRNLMDTARRLHVHRNTVVYRLAKVERLLGHPLGQRPFATQAALTLAARAPFLIS